MRSGLGGDAINHLPREDSSPHDTKSAKYPQRDSGSSPPGWLHAVVQRQRERHQECTRDMEIDVLNPASRPRGERADGQPHMAVIRKKEPLQDDERGEPNWSDDARECDRSRYREPPYVGIAVDVLLRLKGVFEPRQPLVPNPLTDSREDWREELERPNRVGVQPDGHRRPKVRLAEGNSALRP